MNVPDIAPVAVAVGVAKDIVRPPQLRDKVIALSAVKPVPVKDTDAAGAALVGVKVRVVGLVTLNAAEAVATWTPLEAADAATE